MKENVEKRFFKVETRLKKNESGETVLEGFSAVFNQPSENLGWGDQEVREYISPGAFKAALVSSDCRALINHDPNLILGRESAKTLIIEETEEGLRSMITLPDTSYGKDLAVSVARGDIREQSFQFVVARDAWEEDREKKFSKRTILEVKELIDISAVTFPAYPDTSIAKRSYDQFKRIAENSDTIDAENREIDALMDDFFINGLM